MPQPDRLGPRLLLLAAALVACGPERGLQRAERDLSRGDLVAAEARYRAVLDDHPDQPEALFGAGWTYLQSGQPERAREYFTRLRRVAPEDARGPRGLGSVAMAEGRAAEAEGLFREALTLAPQDPKALNSLGLLLLSGGRAEEALPFLQQARDAEPGRGEYGLNLAEALLRLDRHPEALTEIEHALALDIEHLRFRGMLLELRARVLVASTARRVDPTRCAETAPPVLAWLEAADRALDQAAALGVELPNLPATRRLVLRRRSVVQEQCPAGGQPTPDPEPKPL